MNWQEICIEPDLQDLAYKLETNEWGQVVMFPTKVMQGAYQFEIAKLLSRCLLYGQCIIDCAVKTRLGVKLIDVAWLSPDCWLQARQELNCITAPELCIKIITAGCGPQELNLKKHLYFEAGAQEVWICDGNGKIHFYTMKSELPASLLVPEFPRKLQLNSF